MCQVFVLGSAPGHASDNAAPLQVAVRMFFFCFCFPVSKSCLWAAEEGGGMGRRGCFYQPLQEKQQVWILPFLYMFFQPL